MRLSTPLATFSAGLALAQVNGALASNTVPINNAPSALTNLTSIEATPAPTPLSQQQGLSIEVSENTLDKCTEHRDSYLQFCQQFHSSTHRQNCNNDAMEHYQECVNDKSPTPSPSLTNKDFDRPGVSSEVLGIAFLMSSLGVLALCSIGLIAKTCQQRASSTNQQNSTQTLDTAQNDKRTEFNFPSYNDLEPVPEGAPDASHKPCPISLEDYDTIMGQPHYYQPVRISPKNQQGEVEVGHIVMCYKQLQSWVKTKGDLIHPCFNAAFQMQDIQRERLSQLAIPYGSEDLYTLATSSSNETE